MAQDHVATGTHHSEHLLNDQHRIDSMIESVTCVGDIEVVVPEVVHQSLTLELRGAHRWHKTSIGDQSVVLGGEGIDGGHF